MKVYPIISCAKRKFILENIRQGIYAKIGVMVTLFKQLWIPDLLFSRSLKIGVIFAFVVSPKSAVKLKIWPPLYVGGQLYQLF